MKVVIVESPAKAKTINKYLGSDYKVVASFGHVRDLPSKNGSVDPDQDFSMVWDVDPKSERHISEISKLVKGADHLYLATDPDREGEAISWHILEILKERNLLKNMEVDRIVFHEITEKAIKNALANPKKVSQELVDAYLARRSLDYLVGFTLSPVLWRKLPGSRSAGRVQSVALRLITDREQEIEAFKSDEYWSVEALLKTPAGKPFKGRLTYLENKKLDKFSLNTHQLAHGAADQIRKSTFAVDEVENKVIRRNPPPPFTTSTLQQEASRKLGFSASRTMQTAQRLYEGIDIGGETVGLITYMRTDSTNISQDAIKDCRASIDKAYGSKYIPSEPRSFKNKTKNAQEAHEGIRPTDFSRSPESMERYLTDESQRRLYALIWKRMLASQMAQAELAQRRVDIRNPEKDITLRATGTTITFDGFLKLYQEGRDEGDKDEEGENFLPPMDQGDALTLEDVLPEQHFTQPPPRFSEASLVKRLEELGIGRPSTYASIIQVLQDRDYVVIDKKQFIPQARGRVVTAFLVEFFKRYVEFDFTASLEEELDQISNGELSWKKVLKDFWENFKATVDGTKELRITEVLDTLDRELALYLFPPREGVEDPRECPQCKTGQLSLKLSKFGGFIGCNRYPDCTYTHKLDGIDGDTSPQDSFEPKVLGKDPNTGQTITLKRGPYGFYGEWEVLEAPEAPPPPSTGKKKAAKPKAVKPKRVSIAAGQDPESVTLEDLVALGALPKDIGLNPETGASMIVGIGRFGPYIKHQDKFTSIPKAYDPMTLTGVEALEILAAAALKPPRVGRGGFKRKKKA